MIEKQGINILHLDDETLYLGLMERKFSSFKEFHINYLPVINISDFFSTLYKKHIDLIILDINLGSRELNGIDLVQRVRDIDSGVPIVFLSNSATFEEIESCVKAGAQDFLIKGYDQEVLLPRIRDVLFKYRYENSQESRLKNNIYFGETLLNAERTLRKVVEHGLPTVLVLGESGTGKEVVVEILQQILPKNMPFLSLNCGSLVENLVESELFGYKKGSFTGATNDKIGLFKKADGGWIFLDEVARLSNQAQASLLRILENGELRAIGTNQSVKINVKVIAATNENLDMMVENGGFRRDLLERLRGVEINLPPLRERAKDEVGEILDGLVARLNKEFPSKNDIDYCLSNSVRSLFLNKGWSKGNIREMWKTLQSTIMTSINGSITISSLPANFLADKRKKEDVPPEKNEYMLGLHGKTFPELEEEVFVATTDYMVKHFLNGNITQRSLSSALGISRGNLMTRIKRLAAKNNLNEELLKLI